MGKPSLLQVCVMLSLACCPLRAQGLSLEECMRRTMANNPVIRKASKGVDAAGVRYYQSLASFLPSVSVNGLYTRISEAPPRIDLVSLTRPGADAPRIAGNPLLQYLFQDNYTGYLRVNLPLFTGGKNLRTLRASEYEYRMREAELAVVRGRVRVDVVKAFYGILVARETKSLAGEATRQLQAHLERMNAFLKAGTSTEYDYLKAQVQLLSWAPRLARAERDLRNAARRLELLMGTEPSGAVEVEGELVFKEPGTAWSATRAKDQALIGRPEILLARSAYQSGVENTGIKKSALLPQLNFQYNYNLQDQRENFSLDRDAWKGWWDVRLLFAWDVFSFGRRYAEVKENQYRVQQSGIDLQSVSDRVKFEVEDAFDALQESRTEVDLWKKNRELAGRGYTIAAEKFNNGKGTSVDVLDSQVALKDAESQYLKALYDYTVSEADFQRIIAEEGEYHE